jgi:hypothetical protein
LAQAGQKGRAMRRLTKSERKALESYLMHYLTTKKK